MTTTEANNIAMRHLDLYAAAIGRATDDFLAGRISGIEHAARKDAASYELMKSTAEALATAREQGEAANHRMFAA